jgi:hypothetical protein
VIESNSVRDDQGFISAWVITRIPLWHSNVSFRQVRNVSEACPAAHRATRAGLFRKTRAMSSLPSSMVAGNWIVPSVDTAPHSIAVILPWEPDRPLIHPNLAEAYRRKVAALHKALAEGASRAGERLWS